MPAAWSTPCKTTVAEAEPEPVPEPEPEPVQLTENTDPILRLVAGGDEVTGDLLGPGLL